MIFASDVEPGEEKPALIVYAPLSMIKVCGGGGGPDDLVRRCPAWGAIIVDIPVGLEVYSVVGACSLSRCCYIDLD